jgi:transposase
MRCPSCGSRNQADFVAEINVHFRGLRNLDKPGILLFPKLLLCLDCGFSCFTTPATELALLTLGDRDKPSLNPEDEYQQLPLRFGIAA